MRGSTDFEGSLGEPMISLDSCCVTRTEGQIWTSKLFLARIIQLSQGAAGDMKFKLSPGPTCGNEVPAGLARVQTPACVSIHIACGSPVASSHAPLHVCSFPKEGSVQLDPVKHEIYVGKETRKESPLPGYLQLPPLLFSSLATSLTLKKKKKKKRQWDIQNGGRS